MNKKLYVAAAVLVAGGVLFGLWRWTWRAQPEAGAAAPPARVAIVALGRLRPRDGVIDVGGDAGSRVARLLVKEDQQVQEGEPLVYLDNHAEQLANKNYVESQLEGARSQLKARLAVEQANIAKAELDVKENEDDEPLKIRVQNLKISQLRRELTEATNEAQRNERLVGRGAVSRDSFEQKLLKVQEKKNDLEVEEANLAKLKNEQNAALLRSRQSLMSARANYELARWNIDVNSLEKNLDLARARLERTIIRAPSRGQILRIRTHLGEVLRDQTLLQMGDTSEIYAEAEVYESDALLLKTGQKATITASALPGPIQGQLVTIGRLVAKQSTTDLNPAAATDARVVTVRVRLDRNEPANRLINLQVTVTIHLDDSSPAAASTGR